MRFHYYLYAGRDTLLQFPSLPSSGGTLKIIQNALIAAYRQRQLLIGAVTAANASTLSLFSYEDENIKKASGRTRKC